MAQLKLTPKLLFSISGSFFPFNGLKIGSELGVNPSMGYEVAATGTGSFDLSTDSTSYVAGDTITVTIDYSDFEQAEEIVNLAVENDCWPDLEHLPVYAEKVSFEGSGSVEIDWTVSTMIPV